MRALAAASLAFLLAGCAAPEEEDDPLVGLCPAWLQGPGEAALQGIVPNGGAVSLNATPPAGGDGNASWTHGGRPLDLYRITVGEATVPSGLLELRAFSGERQLSLRDFREEKAQLKPIVALDGVDDGGLVFEALLTGIAEEEPAAPGPLRLELQWPAGMAAGASASFAATVTFHYRVCGA